MPRDPYSCLVDIGERWKRAIFFVFVIPLLLMAVPAESCEISHDSLISLSSFLLDLKAREARTLISTQKTYQEPSHDRYLGVLNDCDSHL